jgi:hypothetical protein
MMFRMGESFRRVVQVLGLLVVCGFAGYQHTATRPVKQGAGVIAPNPPVQRNLSPLPKRFGHGDYRIQPLATFTVDARVLSRKRYRFARGADICPIDLALGWGTMSDERVLGDIKIRQYNRYYVWSTKTFPIPRKDIERQSCNMHMVPADAAVRRSVNKVRVGQRVQFTGYLIEAISHDGWSMKSSLSRGDTGANACEIVYVKELRVVEKAE